MEKGKVVPGFREAYRALHQGFEFALVSTGDQFIPGFQVIIKPGELCDRVKTLPGFSATLPPAFVDAFGFPATAKCFLNEEEESVILAALRADGHDDISIE